MKTLELLDVSLTANQNHALAANLNGLVEIKSKQFVLIEDALPLLHKAIDVNDPTTVASKAVLLIYRQPNTLKPVYGVTLAKYVLEQDNEENGMFCNADLDMGSEVFFPIAWCALPNDDDKPLPLDVVSENNFTITFHKLDLNEPDEWQDDDCERYPYTINLHKDGASISQTDDSIYGSMSLPNFGHIKDITKQNYQFIFA